MKNITLSADEDLIERAPGGAIPAQDAFREWLTHYTGQAGAAQEFDSLMERVRHVRARRHFSRDEMNQR